jgi:hypothetical protein
LPARDRIPDELARREERLRQIAAAHATIEARAQERHVREQAEHQAKLAARAAKTTATGKKPGGKPPEPPSAGPAPGDQINLTDEDSQGATPPWLRALRAEAQGRRADWPKSAVFWRARTSRAAGGHL